MNFIACDGTVTTDAGVPYCSGTWMVVPESVVVQSGSTQLTAEDYQQLYGWVLLLMVTAIGFRYVLRVMNQDGGRHA